MKCGHDEDDARRDEAVNMYVPRRSRVGSVGVERGLKVERKCIGSGPERNRFGEEGPRKGEIGEVEGRLESQKALVENILPGPPVEDCFGFGGLGGSSDSSCRGPTPHNAAVQKDWNRVVSAESKGRCEALLEQME